MRFVKAVSMLAGVALLLLGVAELMARRADVVDERERADAVATELAAARFDDLITSTLRALRVVGPAADTVQTSSALGLPICSSRPSADETACEPAVAAVLDDAAASSSGAAMVVSERDGAEPHRVAVAFAIRGEVIAAVVSVDAVADGARLVPGAEGPSGGALSTRFTDGNWAVRLHDGADAASADGFGWRSRALVAAQLVIGAALVIVTLVIFGREHRGLRRRATTDGLTGLPNRAEFERRAEALLARCEREHSGTCLFLVDLDRFKSINDTLGHVAGDRVLIEAAGRLRSAVRESDLVARWGGDEFVLMLVGVGDPLAIPGRAAAIARSLSGIPTIDGGELTAAVGAAVAPLHGTDLAALLEVADRAMYAAKADGSRDASDRTVSPLS